MLAYRLRSPSSAHVAAPETEVHMAVTLEIEDGNPWYLSPNIWAVPGDDPEGPPGTPIADQNCYLYARVKNTGKERVNNATVRFYWANPAVGFDRTTANFLGSAFVSLDGGDSADVLLLSPWVPLFVNDGHQCLLAEAYHDPLDPLPAAAAFNVPTDRHVAQRNISVLQASAGFFRMRFEVHNPSRKARRFTLKAVTGQIEQLRPLAGRLRDLELPRREGKLKHFGFLAETEGDKHSVGRAAAKLETPPVPPRGRLGFALVGEVASNDAVVIHVLQEVDDAPVGGLAVLVRTER